MIKKEYQYFGVVISIFLFSVFSLLKLLNKYSPLAIQHFAATCKQIIGTFFSSGVHYIGLILLVITFLVTVSLLLKTTLSFIKTRRKLTMLLNNRLDKHPNKLQQILLKLGLNNNSVIVVERKLDCAFSYGLFSQKILVSTGLISKLSTSQLEAVILHEQYHSQNKHVLLLTVSEILSSTLFFLPILSELTARMRVVFENQADKFTTKQQNTGEHLMTSLAKVSDSSFNDYPKFAMRRKHNFSKTNVLISIVVVAIGIVLGS